MQKDIRAVIDTTAPTVSDVSATTSNQTYGTGNMVTITITFSGTSTLTFMYMVASGNSSSDLDYASTSSLTLNGGSIEDAAGNNATLTLPSTGTSSLPGKDIVIT